MFKEKLKSFFVEPISIVVIPNSTKKTRQFKIIKAFVVIPALLFFIIFTYYVNRSYQLDEVHNNLDEVVTIKADKIHSLNLIVEAKEKKIGELENKIEEYKNTTEIVNAKLEELHNLEAKVRDMVGLKQVTSDASTEGVSTEIAMEDFDPDTEDLAKLLDNETAQYDDFIKDLEKKMAYNDAIPDSWPVTGRITSKFGYRIHPITNKKQFHKGIDIANAKGTPVKAAATGVVTFSGWNGGYGNVVKISHGYGYKSVYAHNDKLLVQVGDKVNKGDVIANLGSTGRSTGPHVHFEIHYNGQQIDPQAKLQKQ